MITLLERRAAPAVEALGLGWRRQSRAPSIRRDRGTYDADLDRFLADLPLNGVRSQHSQRSYAYDLLVWVRFLDEARHTVELFPAPACRKRMRARLGAAALAGEGRKVSSFPVWARGMYHRVLT